VGGNKLWSEFHKPIDFIWKKKELSQQFMDSISEPVYERGNKSD
jgi:hypothetical protein